ncbi:MAG: acyl-CoA dehydratase activase-related protein [Halanaerobiaceae bacterium]
MTRIGLPRALIYHYYYPGIKEYFNRLNNVELVLSPETNREILDRGINRSVDDLCLPFKVFFGHVEFLLDKVEYLFVPRLLSLGENNRVCPKFMGLPDMVRSVFRGEGLPELIAPEIDLRNGIFPLYGIAVKIGKELGVNSWRARYACRGALNSMREYKKYLLKGFTPAEVFRFLEEEKPAKINANINSGFKFRVGILGHSYILNDEHLTMGLISELKKRKIEVIVQEMLPEKKVERAAGKQEKDLFWYFNRHIMGAAYYLLENEKVDGIIPVNVFGCGPDSLVNELIRLRGKRKNNIPLLHLNLDEHSGKAGLITRLEAFLDLLERRELA